MTIPQAILSGLTRYLEQGIATGSCLRAILEGDLFAAFARADPETRAAMGAIVDHIVQTMPGAIWGSPEAVSRHIEEGTRRAWAARQDVP